MPPPLGTRMTIRMDSAPDERRCSLATCVVIWSNAGKMNPSNWISATGAYPRIARPTAVPMMPLSARGVSITRSSPNRACRPSVTRNTPPRRPMSSPISRTFGSSRIAAASPAFRALAIVSTAMSVPPP